MLQAISALTYNDITYKVGDILKNRYDEYIRILGLSKPNGVHFEYIEIIRSSTIFTSIRLLSKYWKHINEKEKEELIIKEIIE